MFISRETYPSNRFHCRSASFLGNGFASRGLFMGLWNAHTSIGNIFGSLIAGIFVDYSWGWSFVVPGLMLSACGILTFFFLLPCKLNFRCFFSFQLSLMYINIVFKPYVVQFSEQITSITSDHCFSIDSRALLPLFSLDVHSFYRNCDLGG